MPAKGLCRYALKQWDAGFGKLDYLRVDHCECQEVLVLRQGCFEELYPAFLSSGALPCFITMLAASGLLVDRLLRTIPRASIALISLTLTLSAAMVSLGPAKKLLGNIRDEDLSRAYGCQVPKLCDDLPEGTVVLNAAKHTWKYPLLGARLKNRVIDAGERGWHPPFSQSQLDAEAVEVVFFRGSCPSFFADGVASEKIFDDTEDPNRLPTTFPTRVYRILRSESSRYHPESS